MAYADYNDLLPLNEELFSTVAQQVLGTMKVSYQGHEIDLTPPWDRLTIKEGILKYAQDVSPEDLENLDSLKKIAESMRTTFNKLPYYDLRSEFKDSSKVIVSIFLKNLNYFNLSFQTCLQRECKSSTGFESSSPPVNCELI